MHRTSLLSLLVALLAGPAAIAQSPDNTIAYGGRLEQNGAPVEEPRSLRFGLFTSSGADPSCLVTTGTCPVWSEQHDGVDPAGGRFSVALGDNTAIPPHVFTEPELYLGIAVDDPDSGWVLLGNLQRLVAVPRAARTDQIAAPVGSIVAWHPDLFPGGRPSLPAGWVPCNGQLLSDPLSPLNGAVIPNLNGDGRFLRGSGVSGTPQGDQLESHTHLDNGHNHGFRRPRWFGNEDRTGVHMYTSEDFAANSQLSFTEVGYADLGEPVDLSGNPTVSHGGETRPVNMSVVWIMRVR